MKSQNLIGALAGNQLQKSAKMYRPEILHKAKKVKSEAAMKEAVRIKVPPCFLKLFKYWELNVIIRRYITWREQGILTAEDRVLLVPLGRCTPLLVRTVGKNVKYHLNQMAPDLFIVRNVIRIIDQKDFSRCNA